MSEHSRAPREMAVKLAQWVFMRHRLTLTSAAQRAHAPQAPVLRFLPRERAREVALFFLRTCVSKLLVRGRGWRVRTRPCTKRGGRENGAVGFHRT